MDLRLGGTEKTHIIARRHLDLQIGDRLAVTVEYSHESLVVVAKRLQGRLETRQIDIGHELVVDIVAPTGAVFPDVP